MKLPSFPIFSGQKKPKEENFNPFPDLSPTPPPKKLCIPEFIKGKTEYLILSISLLIFFGTLGFYFSSNKNNLSGPGFSSLESNQQIQAIPTPTPTPKPLPTGKQIYNYSHGSLVQGPKPIKIIIDPIDPKNNDEQTLIITVPHDKEIIDTKATLITDNKFIDIKLQKDLENTYSASWKMTDTYDYKYQIVFEFSDYQETFTGALTFR